MHRSLRQTLIYLLTIVASQGLSFLLLPIVTHYLPPTVYGDYALALSVSTLVGTLGSSWIRNVSFRLFYDSRAAGTSRSFFWTVAAAQAFAVTVIYLPTAIVLGTVTHFAPLPVMLSAGLAVVSGDFFAHSASLLRAEQHATAHSAAEIGSGIVRFAATFAGLAAGFRSPVLLFLAAAVSSTLLGAFSAWILQPRLTGPVHLDRSVLRSIVRYGPVSLPLSVSGWAERLLDRLILDHYLTRQVVGVYTANYALADRIIGGLVHAVFMMAWPDILKSWTERGKEGAREALTRGLSLYLWLTTGPAVFIAIFNEELALLLGKDYRGGSGIMPIIVGAAWLSGFNSYLNRHFELTKRFGMLSAVAIGGASVNLVANLVLVPRLGAMGAALATLANFLASGIVFWILRDRELVRLPLDTIQAVVGLVVAAYVASLAPSGELQRPAAFVLVYAAGAAYFVSRRFWKRQVSVA
jgi:O-antigen/teichoic acid export membrane protein